jgi:hypothetical protein
MKYRSNFNVLDLIKLANKELRPSDTPVYTYIDGVLLESGSL